MPPERHFAIERDEQGRAARLVWIGDTPLETGNPTLTCRFCGASLPSKKNPGSMRVFCSPEHRRAAYERDHPRMNLGQRRIEFGPTASKVSVKREGRRLLMLGRLQKGPATTYEMMQLGGAGFSSRIRELRVAGHQITCEQQEDGAIYRLVSP